MSEIAPKQLIVITYGNVFPNTELPSFENLLKDVPTIVLLKYITHEHQKVHYTMYASDVHMEALRKMIMSFHSKARQNACVFVNRNRGKCILMDTISTMHLCFESLKNYVPMNSYEDVDLDPTQKELFNIYCAYLLCNTEWTERQLCPGGSATDMLLKIDVPFSEFLFHKDIECQLYKAFKFFNFCENDKNFSDYLKSFLADLGLPSWKVYLQLIFSYVSQSLNNSILKFSSADQWIVAFWDQYTIDINEIQNIGTWSSGAGLNYLRNHFLVRLSPNMMLLINPDLLIDKLYQGLKFSMFKSINDHRLPSPKGKQFKNLPEFLSLLGIEFSEEFLAGDTLRRCLCSNVDIFKDGKELKQNGVQGESDFYIRKGQSLMIVEYKDVILSDTKKNSDDINELKRAILDKICLDNGNNRKGVGQVLWNIDRVLNGEYSIVDPEYNIVRKIYQIILVTDNVFSSHGVTKLVIEESNKIIKKYTFGNKFISVPIILDIDTLISLSYWLNIGKYDIFDLFDDYLIKNQGNILSFKRYVAQYYLSGKQWIADKSNRLQFMFGDILV